MTKVIGYVRVSTEDQAGSGLGLSAQRSAIEDECARRDWELVGILEDAASGKTLNGRPALAEALSQADGGVVDVLMVAKLDRLSRSLLDFAGLMESGRKKGWALIALDLGVDTTTPAGEMMANVMATFAQFERRLIGERTKSALAVKRQQGVRLGRPRTLDATVVERIANERSDGKTLAAIAEGLNAERVPTAHGGKRWYPSTVSAVLRTAEAVSAPSS